MMTHAVWILVLVVGGVVFAGVVTYLIERPGRAWDDLVSRFPSQGVGHDATRGEAMIRVGASVDALSPARGCLWILMPWTWWRGAIQVRYAIDDEHLHVERDGGRLVPRTAMSIPWSMVEIEGSVGTHMGEHSVLRVGETVVLFPSTAIERELSVRASIGFDAGADDAV